MITQNFAVNKDAESGNLMKKQAQFPTHEPSV